MEEASMFEKFKVILVEDLRINEADIKPEAQLQNDLGINSLELADLILICEEKFGVTIGDDDLRDFVTVADVVKYLEDNAA